MTTKSVYLYDETTGELKGQYEAQESPLEPGVYLEPLHSTPTPPPAVAANQVAVFSAGAWSIEPDYRGQTWYDQTTGALAVIESIGTPASNLVPTSPPAQKLAEAQADQIAAIYKSYAAAIAQNVEYTSKGGVAQTFQADPTSVGYVNSMLSAYGAAQATPTGFYWVAADNTQVPFTYADLQGLAAAMGAQGWAAFQKLQGYKAQIKSATTVSAVQAVVWS